MAARRSERESTNRRARRDVNVGDAAFRTVTAAFAATLVIVLVAIAVDLARAASGTFARDGLAFVTSAEWAPVHGRYGALAFLYGSTVTSVVALVLAVPVAVGVAVFRTEYAPPW